MLHRGTPDWNARLLNRTHGPSHVGEMAAQFFCERRGDDISFDLGFYLQLLDSSALFFELFHARQHGGVHAAVFGTSFVTGGFADTHFTAEVRYWQTLLDAPERIHDLAVGESRFVHVDLLSRRSLLLRPWVNQGGR